jgi:hypothetical protein
MPKGIMRLVPDVGLGTEMWATLVVLLEPDAPRFPVATPVLLVKFERSMNRNCYGEFSRP